MTSNSRTTSLEQSTQQDSGAVAVGIPLAQWFSSEAGAPFKLERQPDLIFVDGEHPCPDIRVDPAFTYQTITGFGSSMEESTVYNLSRLPATHQDKIIRKLFHAEEGIGWNVLRICFGSSDFTAQPYYSYDDVPEGCVDPDLSHFSIQKDLDYGIVDFIQRVLAVNPEVLIVASAWSPPAWMKDSKSLCGGSLLPEFFDAAARYYRKAIQAYEDLGIPIHAFTVQNEPQMGNETYPTCVFTWKELQALLKLLKREWTTHGLTTELWPLDHNFDMALNYAAKLLEDREAYDAAQGISFHDYAGDPSDMSAFHSLYPEKDLYLTERSVWGTKGVDRILQYLRHWSRCYVAWVTCLDDKRQPNRGCHPADPTFVTLDATAPDGYYFIPEYWLCGQISKFVKRGAKRIKSNYGSRDDVTNAAFLRLDGTIVMVAVNHAAGDRHIVIQESGRHVEVQIPARTVASFVWSGNGRQ